MVRLKNPGAKPPHPKATRHSANEVLIDYSSPRKMCFVAKGIARGVAKHYGEKVQLTEKECMHKGDKRCLISVMTVK